MLNVKDYLTKQRHYIMLPMEMWKVYDNDDNNDNGQILTRKKKLIIEQYAYWFKTSEDHA